MTRYFLERVREAITGHIWSSAADSAGMHDTIFCLFRVSFSDVQVLDVGNGR